jgi:hypothetical protein
MVFLYVKINFRQSDYLSGQISLIRALLHYLSKLLLSWQINLMFNVVGRDWQRQGWRPPWSCGNLSKSLYPIPGAALRRRGSMWRSPRVPLTHDESKISSSSSLSSSRNYPHWFPKLTECFDICLLL